MFGSLVYLTYDKAQCILFQGGFGFALERIRITHRRCQFDAAISSYGREIGLPRRSRGLADPGTAVNLIVEDKDREIGGVKSS